MTLDRPVLGDDKGKIGKPRSGLTVSKKWVLPPRPKPGRKPKRQTDQKMAVVKKETKPEPQPEPERKHDHEDGDTCALCSREDCMCETIGLKQERKSSLPSLESILNSADIKMDAVPLKRPLGAPTPPQFDTPPHLSAPPAQFETRPKFTRLSDLQPLQPLPMLSAAPSPLEGLNPTEGCGFCTENTPCACSAETFSQPPLPLPLPPPKFPESDEGCLICQKDALSMLFCVSLKSSKPLATEAVSIPCHVAVRTLRKHPRFAECDLGSIIRRLEVRQPIFGGQTRQVGVQSVNRALQELEHE